MKKHYTEPSIIYCEIHLRASVAEGSNNGIYDRQQDPTLPGSEITGGKTKGSHFPWSSSNN